MMSDMEVPLCHEMVTTMGQRQREGYRLVPLEKELDQAMCSGCLPEGRGE